MERGLSNWERCLFRGGSFPVSLREGVLLVRKDPDKGVHTGKISLYGKCPIKESA